MINGITTLINKIHPTLWLLINILCALITGFLTVFYGVFWKENAPFDQFLAWRTGNLLLVIAFVIFFVLMCSAINKIGFSIKKLFIILLSAFIPAFLIGIQIWVPLTDNTTITIRATEGEYPLQAFYIHSIRIMNFKNNNSEFFIQM